MNRKAKCFFHTLKIKTGHKLRTITIYDKESKEAQRALYTKYEHTLNKHIDNAVYSFRKGRSNWSAMEQIISKIPYYKFYYRCDIKDFFPSINRKYLKKLICSLLDKKVVSQIMEFVTCCKSGISEGSPLSPILSNLVLEDFDKEIQEHLKEIFYIRFGDDMLILSNGRISSIAVYIQEMLRIRGYQINREKVKKGVITEGFDYLGFHINYNGAKIQTGKLENILSKIEAEQDENKKRQIIQGWKAYYRNVSYLPDHPATIKLLLYEKNSKALLKLHSDKTQTISQEQEEILKYALKRLSIPIILKLIIVSKKRCVKVDN